MEKYYEYQNMESQVIESIKHKLRDISVIKNW